MESVINAGSQIIEGSGSLGYLSLHRSNIQKRLNVVV